MNQDDDDIDNVIADEAPHESEAVVVQDFGTEKLPQFSSPLQIEPDGMQSHYCECCITSIQWCISTAQKY